MLAILRGIGEMVMGVLEVDGEKIIDGALKAAKGLVINEVFNGKDGDDGDGFDGGE